MDLAREAQKMSWKPELHCPVSGTNDEWDHFNAFQCGWLKRVCDTTKWYYAVVVTFVLLYTGLWDFKELWVGWPASSSLHADLLQVTFLSIWTFTQGVDMRQCLQVQRFSCPVFFLSVISWPLAGEIEDFCQDRRLLLRTAAGSRVLSLSERQKLSPVRSLQWHLPGGCESNRLLGKRSCEVGALCHAGNKVFKDGTCWFTETETVCGKGLAFTTILTWKLMEKKVL